MNIQIFHLLIYLYRLCPIFQVSNVTGENLNLLKMFLNLLTARMISHEDEPAEFQIDDTYSVPVSILQHISSLSCRTKKFLHFIFLYPSRELVP